MSTFTLFSTEHFLNLGGYLAAMLLLLFLSSIVYRKTTLAKISALLMLTMKLGELVYRYRVFDEPIADMLPLHLCNITFITALIAMLFKSNFFFELTYYWSVGAVFALLTPEVKLSFPNFWNISFFTTHYYLFFVVIYCMIFWKFRPTKSGLYRAVLYLNLIFVVVFIINMKLGTNYLFVNYKPNFESPIDYLGPWPYYILAFEGIGAILFVLLYLPFKKKRTRFTTNY